MMARCISQRVARTPSDTSRTPRPPPPPPPPCAQSAMPEVTLTHTGLVHTSPGFTTPRAVQCMVSGVVGVFVEVVSTLEHALLQWQQLGAGVRPVAHVMNAPAVRIRPGPHLSLALSFILSVVLPGLVVWHLHVRGTLSYPPPQVLPTRVGPVTNVFACHGDDTEEVVQVVEALTVVHERVVLVFQGPREFALSQTLKDMRWFASGDVYVVMSWTVMHYAPLGQHDLDPQFDY